MRNTRIFLDLPLSPQQTVTLPSKTSGHLVRVLRLPVAAQVTLFNGDDQEYRAEISEANPQATQLQVLEALAHSRESPLRITLLAGISRGERMDYTVQKAVELGVHAIQPVFCAATVLRLDADKREQRRVRWQDIAISACEQCGRNRIPPVLPLLDLPQALGIHSGLGLVLHGAASQGLRDLQKPSGPLSLLIGPEGGLNAGEIRQAEAAGFTSIRLGPRVLRTETAAPAALAALQTLWGDW